MLQFEVDNHEGNHPFNFISKEIMTLMGQSRIDAVPLKIDQKFNAKSVINIVIVLTNAITILMNTMYLKSHLLVLQVLHHLLSWLLF